MITEVFKAVELIQSLGETQGALELCRLTAEVAIALRLEDQALRHLKDTDRLTCPDGIGGTLYAWQ